MLNVITTKVIRCFVYGVSLMLVGCGFNVSIDGETDTAPETEKIRLSFATSETIVAPNIAELKATVFIDHANHIELNVNADNTITETHMITDVAVGDHQLTINYYVIIASTEINLATFSTTVFVDEGHTSQVVVRDKDLNKNFDYDDDGYTNVAEVQLGSNPLNGADFPNPSGELAWFDLTEGSFGNARSENNLEMKYQVGNNINGVATSTNFIVVSGLLSDF